MNDEAAKPPRKRASRRRTAPAGDAAAVTPSGRGADGSGAEAAAAPPRKRTPRKRVTATDDTASAKAPTPRTPRRAAAAKEGTATVSRRRRTAAAGAQVDLSPAGNRAEPADVAPGTPAPSPPTPMAHVERPGNRQTGAAAAAGAAGPGPAHGRPQRALPPKSAPSRAPSPQSWKGGGRVSVVDTPAPQAAEPVPDAPGAGAAPAGLPLPEPSFVREVRARTTPPPATPSRAPHPAERLHPRRPPTGWRAKIDPWWRLARFDRPIGFLLLLWPTWWGLWAAAGGTPPLKLWFIFTLGVISMRAAGCVINDYADRWLDHAVKRTRTRPLATGELSGSQALWFFLALLLFSFVLVLFTNALTIRLAFVGAFLAATYPFLKRYTHLPQIYLGMAFGWSIPMAFAAVLGEVPALAWLLFVANILWSTAYDTFYAMVDRDDDLRMGARSTAILLGDMDLAGIALMHGGFLLAMAFAGARLGLGWPYWTAIATAIVLCVHQLWRSRHRDRENCFRAFIDNHWVGMVLFVGLAIGLSLR